MTLPLAINDTLLSFFPPLVILPPFRSHYFGCSALIYTMRMKSWRLSSAANVSLPVIPAKSPAFSQLRNRHTMLLWEACAIMPENGGRIFSFLFSSLDLNLVKSCSLERCRRLHQHLTTAKVRNRTIAPCGHNTAVKIFKWWSRPADDCPSRRLTLSTAHA